MGKTLSPTPQSSHSLEHLPQLVHERLAHIKTHKDLYKVECGLTVRGEVKRAIWTIPAKYKQLELIQITDVQWGNKACNVQRVIEYRDWILSRPNRFVIMTGDNIDAAHMLSKGTTWDNTGPPQDQLFEFAEVWGKARHRILGYVGGNHERRTLTTYGDLGIAIAAMLRVPYSSGKQSIDINFGEWSATGKRGEPFKINQWHGIGGARTKGTLAQSLHRFASDGDAHLYLMGHHHQAMIIPFWKERRGPNGSMLAVKTFAAAGTSFLDLWGSYGETMGMSPSDVLMPRAVIGRNGDFELTLK